MQKRQLNLIIVFLCFCVLLTACGKSNEGNLQTDKPQNESHTLLIYMCGSDLESSRGYASNNIEEILGAEIPENINVILQTGGSENWHTTGISAEHIGRYEIKNGQLTQLSVLPQSNMGDDETLLSFLTFAKENYPAENTSLILWDHGSGSVGGVCFDENYGLDALTLNELDSALSMSDIEFEFVGFDACLMATYDTANVIKNYAEYMIASEELEPASGWDYETLIENLHSEDFYTKVLDSYATRQDNKTYYTLSVIKLSEMSKVERIIDCIIENINADISILGTALDNTIHFGANETSKHNTNLFDLCSFANNLGITCDFSDFIQTANGNARQDATGLSIYFPAQNANTDNNYAEICKNSKYIAFLDAYTNRIPEKPIEFELAGFDNNGKLSFSLTEDSLKYVQSVSYDLHIYAEGLAEDGGAKRMYYIGADNDVTKQHAMYTVNFTGKWVYLNDILLHCDILEEQEHYTVFYAPVIIEDEYCYLIFSYIGSSKKIIIEGYIEDDDIGSRINPLNDGTEISVIYEIPNEANEILYHKEGTVVYDSNTLISVKTLEIGYYQYIPKVIDIYGNVYHGQTAIVYFDGEKITMDDISAG